MEGFNIFGKGTGKELNVFNPGEISKNVQRRFKRNLRSVEDEIDFVRIMEAERQRADNLFNLSKQAAAAGDRKDASAFLMRAEKHQRRYESLRRRSTFGR